MNFMMGCQLNGISGEGDEEREQKEETRKSAKYLIIQTFDAREDFTNIPVLIVDLVSKAWCVNDCQLHPHPLFFNVCTRHTIIKHTHTLLRVFCHHFSHDNLTGDNFVFFASFNKVTQGSRVLVLYDFHTMADGLYFHCFRDLLLGCGQHRLTTDFGLKQCVHQSRLSQATLSCKQKHT